jgi:hypothetical protein
MEINPKVRNAAENGDLEQTVTGGPSQPGDVQVSDDVFGEVGEDGPNYRNVCLDHLGMVAFLKNEKLMFATGRLDCSFGADVEVANRNRRSFHPKRL